MNLARVLEVLGRPVGRRIVFSHDKDGTRTHMTMLTWACSDRGCEPVCVARNPTILDLSMSAIPDNGLWVVEPCTRHAALFGNENME